MMKSNINNLKPDVDQVKGFLQGRMDAVDAGRLSLFGAKKGHAPQFKFPLVSEVDRATEYTVKLARGGYDVYFNQAILKHKPAKGRGAAVDAGAMLGLWFDLDVSGLNHKEKALPTRDQAETFIKDEIPFRASQTIWSGGGFQLHWLFSVPYPIQNENDLEAFKSLSSRFQKTIIAKGKAHGWRFDNTSDPARLLRIPGTFNFKGDPVMVEVIR